MELIHRNIESELGEVLASSRAAALLGPRQAGKSTLAQQLRWAGATPGYYTLDDDNLRSSALQDPYGFVTSVARPAVIDEVQRAPDLMLAIKRVVDAEPNRPGQFLLTGSANLATTRNVADTLPGRVEYVNLWPLSQGEIEGNRGSVIDLLLAGEPPNIVNASPGRAAHAERVVAGGFPEARLLQSAKRRAGYFESYVKGVVGRELPDVGAVRTDPERVERLLRVLAARTSGTVNFSRLARETGLSDTTVKAHLEILEQMFLVVRLRPWSANLGVRQVKTPKYFVADTGLAGALTGVDEARYAALDQGAIAGMLLETFVVMELVKALTWSNQRAQLFFLRDNAGREVDIVIESASGDVAAVEVKAAASVNAGAAGGLRLIRNRLGERFKAGVVIYSGEHTVRLEDRIWAVPVDGLWEGF